MDDHPLLILIAGPYRSGTGGDPDLIAANLARLEAAAWPIFAAGHVPMIGEWVALPVLRLPGESAGADQDVVIAQERGLPVYRHIDQIPVRIPEVRPRER